MQHGIVSSAVCELSLLVLIGLLVGCHAFRTPPDAVDSPATKHPTADADQASPVDDYPAALASDAWIIRVGEQSGGADEQPPKWRHAALEDLLSRPREQMPTFASWIDHPNPLVAANAAIALARLDDDAAVARLIASVRATELKLAVRRAAVEAVGALESAEVAAGLQSLLKQYGDHQGEARGAYSPELHAELLAALAAAAPDSARPALLAAVASPAVEVRLAALAHWSSDHDTPPESLVELASDASPRVRAAAIELLVRSKHPQAASLATARLRDSQLEVRLAAIAALGDMPQADGPALLAPLLTNQPDAVRAAAAAALVRRGDLAQVQSALDDESSQVRLALARAMEHAPGDAAAPLAGRLLADRSGQVSQAAVAAVAEWKLPLAGPLLLDTLESKSFATRQAAAERLAERWPPAMSFEASASTGERAAQLTELRTTWRTTFPAGSVAEPQSHESEPASSETIEQAKVWIAALDDPALADDARRGLLLLGPQLAQVAAQVAAQNASPLSEVLFTEILPQVDPTYAEIKRLDAPEAVQRHQAASALASRCRGQSPNDLVLGRLVDALIPQRDGLAWRSIQLALAEDEREAVLRLNYAALSHPTPEVRRLGCEYCGLHGDVRHVATLLPSLEDENPAVVLAAAEALGACGRVNNPLPLVRLLASRDKQLRLVAATSLARLGQDAGRDALARLSQDTDPQTRRLAAQAMGDSGDAQFTTELVRLLSDNASVRRASLKSLAKLVGQDIGRGEGEQPPPLDEQVRRWRHWHSRQR
jgi:HEAT repeat protein